MTTVEWRACWRDWRRKIGGEKVMTTIVVNAVDEKQARQMIADLDREKKWIERREVTDWECVK